MHRQVPPSFRAGLAFPIALAALALLAACSDGGGGGSPPPVQAPTAAAIQDLSSSATYSVLLVNAADGSPVTDPIALTFSGAATLRAPDGSRLNGRTIVTTTGTAPVAASFTTAAQEFSVLASNRALGWIDTGTRVVASGPTPGSRSVKLVMVNTKSAATVNASARPIAMVVATVATDGSGALATGVTQSTAPKTVRNAEGNNETIGVASLAIPTGTTALTASGARIVPASPLTVSTTYYGTANADSLNAFPGGFSTNISGAPHGTTVGADAGVFITGGFAQFNVVDANGQALKNFDRPIGVAIDVPKSTRSDDGSRLLAAGDRFAIWSFNDATGRWTFERDGVVAEKSPPDAANFEVRFTTTHLSSWNVDYWDASCTGTVNLIRGSDTRPLEIEVTGVTGWRYSKTAPDVRDARLDLIRIPLTNALVRIFDYTSQPQRVLVAEQTGNPCAGMTVDLTGKLPSNANAGVVVFEVSEACSDGSGRRPVPTWTMLLVNNSWSSFYATPDGPVARARHTDLLPGVRPAYIWNPRINNWQTQSVTVTTGSAATVSVSLTMPCAAVTGGAGVSG